MAQTPQGWGLFSCLLSFCSFASEFVNEKELRSLHFINGITVQDALMPLGIVAPTIPFPWFVIRGGPS